MELTRQQPELHHRKPHPIPKMFARIRKAIRPYPKAMLFELKDRGYDSIFEQLCACLISIRTLDETSLPASLKLFEKARDAKSLYKLSVDEIAEAIASSTFAHQKAERLKEIARLTLLHHDGELPCDFDKLTDLPGVGPKCASLVLGIACGKAKIGVDIHVHRITNRWGYIAAGTPEKTLAQLEAKLPRAHWVEMNELLVPFGKHICTGKAPKCSTCPVAAWCDQVGVTTHR